VNIRQWRGTLLLAASLGAATAAAQHGPNFTDPDHAGIWKAVTPRDGTMHGEFGNHDPIGVSAGVKIKADCSINWVDPDSGRLYCFSSATSLEVFLDAPHAYLSLARRKWDDLNKAESR
jgi:YHS domain-containing protein